MVSAHAPTAPGADGHAGLAVHNPATGDVVGRVAELDAEAVAELARRGRAAQPGWEALGFEVRARLLRRMQKWCTDNGARIVETIVSETGKTHDEAQAGELTYCASALGFWAREAAGYLADHRVRSSSIFVKGRKLLVRYQPLGLIGVIGPWNYPLITSFGDCIPALAAGNAVILKPSEQTPLTSLLMAEGLATCGFPRDVLQVATGRGETGAALVDQADMVMFTGSTATGRKILERAARTLTPVSLELGGKDPMVVLSDADLERAANAAVYYSMQNSGQACISVERCYVEDPVYEDFVARVTEKVGALRQGDPSGGAGSVEVGAMTLAAQVDLVEAHVDDARRKGARVLTGGRRHGSGGAQYYEPTVLADVDHSMTCMTEETFGPTLPIMRVRDAEEALGLANDTPYGLAGSVYTRDVVRGEQLARRMACGAACVNDAVVNFFALELPMGGWKASGLGSRHGADGIRKFCARQAVLVSRLPHARDVYMFPYGRRTTRALGALLRLLYGRGDRG